MFYGNIKKCDVADGPGVRVSLFVSGCRHHCKGCFQPETWSFTYGKPYTKETENEIIEALSMPYISGLTLLGGEPMEPENQPEVLKLLERVKETYPQKTIWCYSGYTYETDMAAGGKAYISCTEKMLDCLDVLVDGEFIEELKDITLRFKGSQNQRIIDMKKSSYDHVVLWEDLRFS